MQGRRRVAAGDTTPSRYRGSDGRWHARVTIGSGLDGRPIRKHLSRATKSELERAVRDLERSRDAGTTTWTSGDSTLQQWLEHWLEAILPSTVRWKTLSTYRSQVRLHVIPILGAARLSELRPETLEELYRRLLDAGSSPHVVHAVHRVLRSALNEAVRRQRLAVNPALIARPPRVAVVEVQPLTADECRAILRTRGGRTRRRPMVGRPGPGAASGRGAGFEVDGRRLGRRDACCPSCCATPNLGTRLRRERRTALRWVRTTAWRRMPLTPQRRPRVGRNQDAVVPANPRAPRSAGRAASQPPAHPDGATTSQRTTLAGSAQPDLSR